MAREVRLRWQRAQLVAEAASQTGDSRGTGCQRSLCRLPSRGPGGLPPEGPPRSLISAGRGSGSGAEAYRVLDEEPRVERLKASVGDRHLSSGWRSILPDV